MGHVSDTIIQDSTVPASERGIMVSQVFSSPGDGVGGSHYLGLDSSVRGMDEQGVMPDVFKAIRDASIINHVSYKANITIGQVNDAQEGVSVNHMPRRSGVFSGVRDSEAETERWLIELRKYASCPIEENEQGGASVRRGKKELRNLVSSTNYDRRPEEVWGGNVSQ
ncbi:hypothetical protein CsSME_00027992 [Camellia sinensis var. sinensis]